MWLPLTRGPAAGGGGKINGISNPFSVSFVLPMFNESENIRDTVREIKNLAVKITGDYEIVIVDDASTDKSADIASDIARTDNTVKVFRMERNSKFGGAFAKGFKEASKDVILYMDSDMPVSAEDILASFPLIADADIVTGYSKIKKGDTAGRKVISRVYNFLIQLLFGLNIKDINSGYKVVRRELVDDIRFVSRSPFIDVELFLHAKKKSGRVRQFPLIFRTRAGGKSHIARLPVILATFKDMIVVKVRSYGGGA